MSDQGEVGEKRHLLAAAEQNGHDNSMREAYFDTVDEAISGALCSK